MSDLGKATVFIGADIGELQKGLKQAMSEVSSASRSMAIAIGAITAAFAAGVMGSVRYGEEIYKVSEMTGISTESISRLKYAAEQNETSFGALTSSVRIFSRNIYEANTGNTKLQKSFIELGMAASDFRGMGIDKVLLAVSDKFKEISDPAQKAALAMQLFGRGGAEIIPLLSKGSEELSKFFEEADKLGVTLSGKDAKAFDDFGDSLNKMKQYLTGIWIQISKDVIPAINNFLNALQKSNLLKDLSESLKETLKILMDMPGWIKLSAAAMVLLGTATGKVLGLFLLAPDILRGWTFIFAEMERYVLNIARGITQWFAILPGSIGTAAEAMLAQIDAELATINAAESVLADQESTIGKLMDDLSAFKDELDSFDTSGMSKPEKTEGETETSAPDIGSNMAGFTSFITDFKDTVNQAIEATKNLGVQAGNIIVNQVQTLSKGFGDAVANMLIHGKNFGESMKELFQQMAASFISGVISMILQWVIFQGIQIAFMPLMVAAGATAAATLATIWAPVAALVSLATLGANAEPAGAAILGITALAEMVGMASYATGGIAGLNGPEIALVGEREPELITPLSKLGSMGDTYNIDISLEGAQVSNDLDIDDFANKLGLGIKRELRHV